MIRLTRPAPLAVFAAVLSSLMALSPAEATPAYSWNLSRDLLTPPATNPDGAWTFMESTNASPTLLTAYTPIAGPVVTSPTLEYWQGMQGGLIGVPLTTTAQPPPAVNQVHGVPLLHPGSGTHVAVRWTNTTGIPLGVRLLGRVTDMDRNGPDGVNFYVVRQNGSLVLASGTVAGTVDNDGRVFSASTGVLAGQSIYFIIERRAHYFWDSTELDVLIAGAYDCSVPNPPTC